jgi:hypothetical protein
MPTTQTRNWYQKLNDNIHSLAEEFGLDDVQTNRFTDFTVNLAKEQYKNGNKSGIAWAFKQAREKNPHAQTTNIAV